MQKLSVEQKSILELFSNKKTCFLIPDYQRPYEWGERECGTLWEDFLSFAFPYPDINAFDMKKDEYFLGPIVMFRNDQDQLEIIDGQQRLTTIMLLLRAFYEYFDNPNLSKTISNPKGEENSRSTLATLTSCIWMADEFNTPEREKLKIISEVATDHDRNELEQILKTGKVNEESTSLYAANYRFFIDLMDKFIKDSVSYFPYLPVRIVNNCNILALITESQDSALRIFSTLNDRGKPLSNADIFKAKFFNNFVLSPQTEDAVLERNKFVDRWKRFEYLAKETYSGAAVDEIFLRYMYYNRAVDGVKSTSVAALRKYYEQNDYELLKDPKMFHSLYDLALFWYDVTHHNTKRFTDPVLRKLCILEFAPNAMWSYFISVYYLANKNKEGLLEEEPFIAILDKITAFTITFTRLHNGINWLRSPIFTEMLSVVNHEDISFAAYKFKKEEIDATFAVPVFNNRSPITKSILAWWAFQDPRQKLLPINEKFELEHFYTRYRQKKENSLSKPEILNYIGNKSLLEQKIVIPLSLYSFADRKRYYTGQSSDVKSNIYELSEIATNIDFTEDHIKERTNKIVGAFKNFIEKNGLIA